MNNVPAVITAGDIAGAIMGALAVCAMLGFWAYEWWQEYYGGPK